MMTIDLGCFSRIIASLEEMTVFPLKGKPGIGRDFAPVAMMTFLASRISVVPFSFLTSTFPEPWTEPKPLT